MNHIALTIAGSDSGGGAGIQADLKTFSAFKVYGTSVITCITAQNPDSVTGIEAVSANLVEKQIQQVTGFFDIKALKTGMLYSSDIIHTIAQSLKNYNGYIVVDPVMVSTSGTRLLQTDAIDVLKKELIPLAELVTPNIDEMEILLEGYKISSIEAMKQAIVLFYEKYKIKVLLKGGHLKNSEVAADLFYNGIEIKEFSTKFIHGVNTHGTGCTYSAAITAGLASGVFIEDAIRDGKDFIQLAIENGIETGRGTYLNHLSEFRRKN